MKKLLIAIGLAAASLSLPACSGVLEPPASVADKTKLDEQAAIGVNLAYKAFRLSVETGVAAGFIKPGSELALKIADADNRAYSAVVAVDAAYRAGNSADYTSAVIRANAAIAAAVSIVSGRK